MSEVSPQECVGLLLEILLFDNEGRVLLVKRSGMPIPEKDTTQRMWFAPGGALRPMERIEDAIRRFLEPIAAPDSSADVNVSSARLHGVYRHQYEYADAPSRDGVVFAYAMNLTDVTMSRNMTHLFSASDAYKWLTASEVGANRSVHPFAKCYFHPLAFNRLA